MSHALYLKPGYTVLHVNNVFPLLVSALVGTLFGLEEAPFLLRDVTEETDWLTEIISYVQGEAKSLKMFPQFPFFSIFVPQHM